MKLSLNVQVDDISKMKDIQTMKPYMSFSCRSSCHRGQEKLMAGGRRHRPPIANTTTATGNIQSL